ncbi:hypothetical protein BAE44_0011329, partial [Dichanthelium oligosanthes]
LRSATPSRASASSSAPSPPPRLPRSPMTPPRATSAGPGPDLGGWDGSRDSADLRCAAGPIAFCATTSTASYWSSYSSLWMRKFRICMLLEIAK